MFIFMRVCFSSIVAECLVKIFIYFYFFLFFFSLQNFPSLAHRYMRIMALMILFLSDICFTTFHIVINQNTNPRICVEAHVAGALFGLIFGFFIYSSISKASSNVMKRELEQPSCLLVACNS